MNIAPIALVAVGIPLGVVLSYLLWEFEKELRESGALFSPNHLRRRAVEESRDDR